MVLDKLKDVAYKLKGVVGVTTIIKGCGLLFTNEFDRPTRQVKAFFLLRSAKKQSIEAMTVIKSYLYCADNHRSYVNNQFLFDIMFIIGKWFMGRNKAVNLVCCDAPGITKALD